MVLSTTIKDVANRLLNRAYLHIDTLTKRQTEAARIRGLGARGQFDRPVYPLLPGMAGFSAVPLIDAQTEFGGDLARMMLGRKSPGFYIPENDFYRSPDAEVLYLMVRSMRPKTIIEIGSGNSTRIVRQAISDGSLTSHHVAIDPAPRNEVREIVDELHLQRFEDLSSAAILDQLGSGDILFIDSSHEVRVANDVAMLFCNVLPALAKGVVVHVHDIFLPFDYPEEFASRFPDWGEQYVLQVYLAGRPHEILWPGFYAQMALPEIAGKLPFLSQGLAQSFWFKVG